MEMMNITPPKEFLQACVEVLGEIELTPAVVIEALRDDRLCYLIREAHARILTQNTEP